MAYQRKKEGEGSGKLAADVVAGCSPFKRALEGRKNYELTDSQP